MKILVPDYIKTISNEFKSNGFELYLVGGCVRDAVLGKTPKDYDLTTNALPDTIISILDKFNWKLNLQGKKFGVIALFGKGLPKEGIEIATFRQDLTSGRFPEVKVGTTIEEDVKRRDITINAMFYDIFNEKIVDLVGGMDDIKNGIIRMVGDPFKRIEEDHLRILRVARFSATLGFKIEESTKEAIKKSNLDGVSMERIWDEFSKSSKYFNTFKSILIELLVLDKCFQEFKLNNTLVVSENYLIHLSNLFLFENPKEISSKLVRFKLDKTKSVRIEFLLKFLTFDPNNIYLYWNNFRKFNIYKRVLLDWCKINNILDIGEKFVKFNPIHNTDELMSNGFKGKLLGEEINKIEKQNFLSI